MLYFAYCTLLDEDEMRRFIPDARQGAPGTIAGWALRFHSHGAGRETGGCNIVPAAGHVIHGVLYDLSDDQAAELDRISGVADGLYEHIDLTVETADGNVAASTYRIPQPGGDFAPTEAYTAPIFRGAAGLGLPQAYQDELAAIVATARATPGIT